MSKETPLTYKQDQFAQKFIELDGNRSKAYGEAGYSVKNKTEKTVNEAASRLYNNSKVLARIKELQNTLQEKAVYTITDALKTDQEMVQRYLKHVEVLQNPEAGEKELLAAKRTLQFIGVSGFNAARERIGKMLGHFEKDKEKQPTVIYTVAVTKEEAKEISDNLENEF